jgi:O-antigen/teichoic acid export membrane protein
LAAHVPHGSPTRSVALLASGTALGQAVAVFCTPVWTRFYSPDQTGLFALFMACASFTTAAVTLRYEIAIPNAAEDSDADAVLLLSMAVSLPLSLLLSGLIFLLVKFDIISLGRLPLWSAFALVPTLLMTGLFCALRYWLVRKKDFHTISKVLVVQGTVRGVVPILFGLLQVNWTGLMLGEIAARLSGVYKMFLSALPALRQQLRQHGWQAVFRAGRENWSFPGLVLPSALLDLLALTLPVPLIAHYYGPAAAGVFFIAQRLTTLPVSFIGASVADVFHITIAEAFRNRPAEVKPLLIETMARLAKLGLVILGPLAIVAPFACGRLFGGQYAQAGPLVAVLFPWCFAQLISSPLSRLLVVADRNALLLLFDVVALGAVLLGFYIGHVRAFSFLQCTALVSALMTLAYAVYAAILAKVADDCRALTVAPPPYR